VAALSDKIAVKVLNPHIERDETAAYGVTVTPAVAVEGTKDYGIRFLGVPAGYEFSNLIDSIVAVSRGESQLKDESKTALAGLTEDVNIKVFATPT
jgi:alkyl hydroperoxide reductase subunit AhpF